MGTLGVRVHEILPMLPSMPKHFLSKNRPILSFLQSLFWCECTCYGYQFSFKLKLELIAITKISHLDSLWKRGWGELGNDLLQACITLIIISFNVLLHSFFHFYSESPVFFFLSLFFSPFSIHPFLHLFLHSFLHSFIGGLWLENETIDDTTQAIPLTLITVEATGHGDSEK